MPPKKVFIRYDAIEAALLNGDVQAGVIIHENRFTYQDKGLQLITDLGRFWETQTGQPIPLGGIAVKKELPLQVQQKIDTLVRRSVEYAFAHYPQLTSFVRSHAQEMSETVMRQHIDLYVNSFSINLGEAGKTAVLKLLNAGGGNWAEGDVFSG